MLNLQEIIAIEDRFYANNGHGHDQNPEIISLAGETPVLLAAPHAVKHPRHKAIKKSEALTGTLVTQLAQQANAHGLILGKTNGEDPNFDPDGPYKRALASHIYSHQIACVINIHGMASHHPWDIVIGSAFGQSLGGRYEYLSHTVNALKQVGIGRILVDDASLFTANNPNNISFYSYTQCQTPSFQIEINRQFRDPTNHPDKYHQILTGLTQAIYSIAKLS